MPTYRDLGDALDALEDYVANSIPIIAGAIGKLTDDLRRFGPPELPLPDISFPLFTVPIPPPPPPPPPPPALTYGDRVIDWTGRNKYALIGAGVVGLGLAAGGLTYMRARRVTGAVQTKQHARQGKEVVVVLGADSPFGPLVVSDLRSRGYIVIASVASEDAVADIEKIDRGFIKALVLDPYDPSSTTPFFRSLQSTLSLRFPLAPGDPYRTPSPSELPALVSLVSLLSLTPSGSQHTSRNLSTLPISNDYFPHLIATHLTPLAIIQSIIPLFRATRKKTHDNGRASIIITLPGGPSSAGLVGQDPAPAMASAAMAKASEILRRELSVSSDLTGTRVVVIDVGEVSVNPSAHPSSRSSHGCCSARRPTDARQLSDAIARVAGGSMQPCAVDLGTRSNFGQTIEISLRTFGLNIRDWWRGDRFSIGSGAAVYSLASYLPTRALDFILLLPERMISYRDQMRRRAREIKREMHERKRENKERARARAAQHEEESEVESVAGQSKEVAIVPKTISIPPVLPPLSPAAPTLDIAMDQRVPGVASNVPITLAPAPASPSVDNSPPASEPDLESVPSSTHSSEDEHEGGRIAESWVMDVDAGGVETH
ncbi:hypothetical protein FRB98_005343 [Tulasnella sp. 332]|nr:hypothetical protein FRB98_005343 [Tulasnella sp. 332]